MRKDNQKTGGCEFWCYPTKDTNIIHSNTPFWNFVHCGQPVQHSEPSHEWEFWSCFREPDPLRLRTSRSVLSNKQPCLLRRELSFITSSSLPELCVLFMVARVTLFSGEEYPTLSPLRLADKIDDFSFSSGSTVLPQPWHLYEYPNQWYLCRPTNLIIRPA